MLTDRHHGREKLGKWHTAGLRPRQTLTTGVQGFESEHHEKALRDLPNVRHRIDHQAKRFGILTTEDIKYGMMTLTNSMLRDRRINVLQPLMSEDPAGNRRRLREQMGIIAV